MEKAIQFDTNWRMGNLFFNQNMEGNSSKQEVDTNKSNGNARWWRTNKRKDPNAMDVNALTMEERGMLLRQGKCFCCMKTEHMAKDCPPEQEESLKKKVDPARFAYTMIKVLTKEQRESFIKMVMEDKDGKDFLKRRTSSTSVSPSLSIQHVQVAQIKKNTMTVDILILGESLGQKKIVEATTLLDTRAGGKFINQNFVQNQKIETKELKYPIEVFNVDGTPNK
jgi:hypothetical protein